MVLTLTNKYLGRLSIKLELDRSEAIMSLGSALNVMS